MGGSSADSSGSTPPADKGLAPWEAWTALVKGNAGPGLLSLPFAFSLVGPVAGPILVCLVGIVVAHNLSSLVACKQSMHAGSKCISTYGDLARDSLGRRGEIVVEVFQVLVQLSVCSAYFSFVSDNLAQVLPSFPQRVFIVIFFPVMASLCVWLTRMQQLAPVSAVANVILLAGVVCILVIVGRAWGEVGDVQEVKFVVSNIPLFLGQTVYSFGGISLMLPIENAVADPDCIQNVIMLSVVTLVVLFVGFGEICILGLGEVDDGSITSFLQEHDVGAVGAVGQGLLYAQTVLITLDVVLTYPLQFYPAADVILSSRSGGRQVLATSDDAWGADENSKVPEADEDERATAVLLNRHEDVQLHGCVSFMGNRLPCLSSSSRLRVGIAALTAFVALVVPNVGLLVGLAGSFSSATLNIIMPPLIKLALSPDCSFSVRGINWCIVIFGAAISVFGTFFALADIVETY